MAMNPLPLIALAGAALLLMKKGDEEDEAEGTGNGNGFTDTTGFGSPCRDLLGIYEARTSSNPLPPLDPEDDMKGGTNMPNLKQLPLTLDAFQKLRQFMITALNEDYKAQDIINRALAHVSKGRPVGSSTSGDLNCGWIVSMKRDDPPAEWSPKQIEVYKAAKELLFQIKCSNMYGVWYEPSGGNLPVTKEFYDAATSKMTELKDEAPSLSKFDAVIQVLNSNIDTRNCAWLSPDDAPIPYSDRMTDVYQSTEVIYDQVFGA